MGAEGPTPDTTLVVILGASQWPVSLDLQASEAFANSARDLKAYLLHPYKFGLPRENLLDLFDTEQSSDDVDVAIEGFLNKRINEMKDAHTPAKDVLVYFIGHGGFTDRDSDFYLAIRRTRTKNPSPSAIRVVSLARNLKENARRLRRILVLDCCFAAAAFRAFQSEPAEVAIVQTIKAFKHGSEGNGFPTRGTSLLCSSRHHTPSLLSPDGEYTMFTKALLDVLSTEHIHRPSKLSLRDIAMLTADVLDSTLEGNAPRPEVHSPDQSEGDIADIPFFPNPALQTIHSATLTLQREALVLNSPEHEEELTLMKLAHQLMRVQVKTLYDWKTEHENLIERQDGYCFDVRRGLFAVAHGIGTSPSSAQWANILVRHFVDIPLMSNDPFEVEWWVRLAQQKYNAPHLDHLNDQSTRREPQSAVSNSALATLRISDVSGTSAQVVNKAKSGQVLRSRVINQREE